MNFHIQNGVLKKAYGCDTHVLIPNSVTVIGDYAFQNCRALQSVSLPDSLTTIGRYVFSNCHALQSVSIPDSLAVIEEGAFSDCNALQSISISPNHAHFCFKNDIFLSRDGTLICAIRSITHAVIPDSVMFIENGAFSNCTALQSITLPDSVTVIGNKAFSDCIALQSVFIPDSVTTVGYRAFVGCTALQSISLPDSITTIERGAFIGCRALQSVSLSASITSISDWTFSECTALQSIFIPPNHPYFYFKNDLLLSQSGTLVCAINRITHAVIPDSVTVIGNCAFSNCTALQSVSIPDSVTSIGESAFQNCTALQSVSIPDSVTSIGECAFQNCTALQSVSISWKHFEYNGVQDALHHSDSITCIVPLSDIPEQYHIKACIGYALHENEYSEELREEYLDDICTLAAELYNIALRHPDLLRLMCREGLIDADSFPVFLDESIRLEAVELTALLLNYKHTRLTDSASEWANDGDFSP